MFAEHIVGIFKFILEFVNMFCSQYIFIQIISYSCFLVKVVVLLLLLAY